MNRVTYLLLQLWEMHGIGITALSVQVCYGNVEKTLAFKG